MRNDFESNYLAHHGILGMKWGKRNGPPYPLGAEDHSQSEKKAGYKKSLGGGRNEELYATKKKSSLKNKIAERKQAKAADKEERKELYKKVGDEWRKATDYADKHGLDYDDYVDESERDAFLKERGNSAKARAIVEYSKLSDKATINEDQLYSEYRQAKAQRKGVSQTNTSQRMKIDPTDSAVTKRVKKDYNELSDQEFAKKYATTKEVYKKRVDKYGDPYMNSPLAKFGKAQAAKQSAKRAAEAQKGELKNQKAADKVASKYDKKLARSQAADEKLLAAREKNKQKISDKYDKKIAKTQADIDSYNPIKEGFKDKKGRDILTKEDVSSMINELNKRKEKLQNEKSNKLADFDDGTKFIKQGQQRYNDIITNYKNVKVSAIDNKAFKGSKEYKDAVVKYSDQLLSNVLNNGYSNMTKLNYSFDVAKSTKERIKSLKSSGKSTAQIAKMTGYSEALIKQI